MINGVGPLDWRIPITDSSGKPSPEFQRKWSNTVSRSGDTMTGPLYINAGTSGTTDYGLSVTSNIAVKSGATGAGWSVLDSNSAAGVSGFYAAFNSAGTRIGYTGFYNSSTFTAAMTDGGTALDLGANNTLRIRLDPNGRVYFGGIAGPSAAAELFSFYANSAINIVGTHAGSSFNNATMFLAWADTGATAFDFIGCYSNSGTAKARVDNAGNFFSATNSYGSTSSIEIKENVTDATPKLDELNQVRVVNYNYIGDELKQLGVIAEEVQEIWPGLVEDIPATDMNPGGKFVKYSILSIILLKAVQELSAKVDALTEQINAS